jgi:hypothetical protein
MSTIAEQRAVDYTNLSERTTCAPMGNIKTGKSPMGHSRRYCHVPYIVRYLQ